MTTTRRVRAGAIDTSTLETPIRMVAGEVEQKPMPIEFAGDESAYDLRGKDYEDEYDDSMAFLAVLATIVIAFLAFIGATIWAS